MPPTARSFRAWGFLCYSTTILASLHRCDVFSTGQTTCIFRTLENKKRKRFCRSFQSLTLPMKKKQLKYPYWGLRSCRFCKTRVYHYPNMIFSFTVLRVCIISSSSPYGASCIAHYKNGTTARVNVLAPNRYQLQANAPQQERSSNLPTLSVFQGSHHYGFVIVPIFDLISGQRTQKPNQPSKAFD